jgi:hypothetical protein
MGFRFYREDSAQFGFPKDHDDQFSRL